MLDKQEGICYDLRRWRNAFDAAIAQVVVRILGKDEVTSSSLVSSSQNRKLSKEFPVFVCNFRFMSKYLFNL